MNDSPHDFVFISESSARANLIRIALGRNTLNPANPLSIWTLSRHRVINAACREYLWKKFLTALQQSFLFNYSIDDAVPINFPQLEEPLQPTDKTADGHCCVHATEKYQTVNINTLGIYVHTDSRDDISVEVRWILSR